MNSISWPVFTVGKIILIGFRCMGLICSKPEFGSGGKLSNLSNMDKIDERSDAIAEICYIRSMSDAFGCKIQNRTPVGLTFELKTFLLISSISDIINQQHCYCFMRVGAARSCPNRA